MAAAEQRRLAEEAEAQRLRQAELDRVAAELDAAQERLRETNDAASAAKERRRVAEQAAVEAEARLAKANEAASKVKKA